MTRWAWLRYRTTGDLLLLMIATTICSSILLAGLTIALMEILHPESNSDRVIGIIADIINMLIGLLAGFLAGRTDAAGRQAELAALGASQK